LLQATDERQIAFASSETRILVTHDDDFLALAQRGTPHAGIAYCHPASRSIGQIIAGLMLIPDCLTPAEMQMHVEFL
jgi:predicted nuclease of predicted toxin-antitoxin system